MFFAGGSICAFTGRNHTLRAIGAADRCLARNNEQKLFAGSAMAPDQTARRKLRPSRLNSLGKAQDVCHRKAAAKAADIASQKWNVAVKAGP